MKHYLIYQIRNKLNGMIYIGQHQTENIDDGYMGSGVRIVRAIEKYGVENFEKTILFECSSAEEMNAKEAEIVDEDFIARDDVYNIIEGGENGSWQKVHQKGLDRLGGINAMKKNKAEHRQIWADFWNSLSDEEKIQWRKDHPTAMHNQPPSWKGKHHSEQTKQKMSKTFKKISHQQGEKNSNYGKHWIHNDELKLRICVSDALYWEYLGIGWINGRGSYMTKESRKKCSDKAKQHRGHFYINNGIEERCVFHNDEIPNGFVKGKIKGKHWNKTAKQHAQDRKRNKAELKYQELRPMLDVYETEGFQAVVDKFQYKYSRNNLVQAFKAYIPEYVPNKHTRRTKAKDFQNHVNSSQMRSQTQCA